MHSMLSEEEMDRVVSRAGAFRYCHLYYYLKRPGIWESLQGKRGGKLRRLVHVLHGRYLLAEG